MRTRSGGELLVECLRSLGASTSFGVPGESYLAVLDALHDARGSFDFVSCRQEGGAAFMAAAWGKLTGAPGVCFVTRGPGATNASIGVHTAHQDSSPMLLFVGQVATGMRDREAFQEIDYRAFFGTVAKWVVEIDAVERIPEIVSRAWTTAVSGRPGPVVVALPEDVLTATTNVPPLRRAVVVHEPAPSLAALLAVRDALATAHRPLLLVGGGGWTAAGRSNLKRLVERLGMPALVAFRFQDLLDHTLGTYAGDAGVGMLPATKTLFAEADLVLALNVRFGEMTTDGWTLMDVPVPRQTLLHVHASSAELGKVYAAEVAVQAGPNAFVASLLAAVDIGEAAVPDASRLTDWTSRARHLHVESLERPAQPGPLDMGEVVRVLEARLPADAILTNGAGNFAVWTNKYFQFHANQRLLAPQSGSMGYGLPAAISAKIRHPARCVVCIAGDGDLQMTMQELGSAMQADARPVVLVVDNRSYGTIRMHQEETYPERVSGTTIENPDFGAIAGAYGFHTERVERTDEVEAAIERALASKTGALVHLVLSIDALSPRRSLAAIRSAARTSSD